MWKVLNNKTTTYKFVIVSFAINLINEINFYKQTLNFSFHSYYKSIGIIALTLSLISWRIFSRSSSILRCFSFRRSSASRIASWRSLSSSSAFSLSSSVVSSPPTAPIIRKWKNWILFVFSAKFRDNYHWTASCSIFRDCDRDKVYL